MLFSINFHLAISASVLYAVFFSIADIPMHLFHKLSNSYTDKQKEFAVTLHFYSPKAYDYMRTLFPLPHVRTLRQLVYSYFYLLIIEATKKLN